MAIPEKIRQLEEQIRTSVEHAVDGLRGGLRERVDQYYQQLVQTLEEARTDLPPAFLKEDDFSSVVSRAVEDAMAEAGAQASLAAARGMQALREGLAAIDGARGQAAVLRALQGAADSFADRSIVFLVRDDRLHGWGVHGFEGDDHDASRVTFGATDGVDWASILTDGGVVRLASSSRAALASRFEAPVAVDSVAVPMILRDRTAAYLFAERAAGDGGTLDVSALQSLTYAAALAIETLPFRTREATATLAAAPAPVDAEVDAEDEPLAASDSADDSGTVALAVEDTDEPETVTVEEVEEYVEPETALPEVEQAADEVELDPAVEEYVEEGAPIDDYAVGDALYTDEVSEESADESYVEPVEETDAVAGFDAGGFDAEGFAAEEVPIRDEPAEDEAVEASSGWNLEPAAPVESVDELPAVVEPTMSEPMMDEPPVELETEPSASLAEAYEEPAEPEPPSAPVDPAPAEPVEERPEPVEASPDTPAVVSGGPVQPPQDVEGPGWAFSAPLKEERSDDENASHEEARRLARLLVSEIKLYNEDEVLEGRRHNDVYERLRDDIERSRQHYDEQVEANVRDTTDYFYQEMVRLLGAGDPKTLGI